MKNDDVQELINELGEWSDHYAKWSSKFPDDEKLKEKSRLLMRTWVSLWTAWKELT